MLRLWEWSDLIRIVFDDANAPNFSEVLNFDLGIRSNKPANGRTSCGPTFSSEAGAGPMLQCCEVRGQISIAWKIHPWQNPAFSSLPQALSTRRLWPTLWNNTAVPLAGKNLSSTVSCGNRFVNE